MQADLSKRAYLAVVAVATAAMTLAALHGIADVWLWGHNGFNGAAFFNAARNSLRFGVVGQALYHFDTRPPPPSALYTHHPLLLHFHLTAALKLFGIHEWAGRAVPAFYSVVDLLALAWVTQRWWSRRLSAIACVVYVLIPLNLIFANMIDHEQGSIACLLIGLDGVVSWMVHGRRRDVAQACAAFAVAAQWDWPAYPIAFLVFCIVAWRSRRQLRPAVAFLVPFALTMSLSFGAFFGWIWHTRGNLADMRSSLALRTSPVDGYALRLWERSLDLYGPILLALFAVGLVLVVKRREPRTLIVLAFFLGQVFHTLVFRQAGFIHAYWTWHANPALAIAVAEAVLGGCAWALARGYRRSAIATCVVLLAWQAVFAARQFQWGYATGAASYAYSASDTDQREENLWAREVGRMFPREGTRYWISSSIHRRRTEFDAELDAPSLPGEMYLLSHHATQAHEVALLDLHHLNADSATRKALRKTMNEHAAWVFQDRFIAIDLAAPPAALPRLPFQVATVEGELHGGSGGIPFQWTCPEGERVTRVEAAFDGGRLAALQPVCDTVAGPWLGGRFTIRPKAPLGWLIGHPRTALPTRSIVCADGSPLRDLRITAERTVSDLSAVCEGERVVVGLRGHYGDLLDGVAVEYAP